MYNAGKSSYNLVNSLDELNKASLTDSSVGLFSDLEGKTKIPMSLRA